MQTASAADDDRVDAAKEEPARQRRSGARAEVLTLTGPGGLLGRVTRRALEGELDAHMGYARPDRAGRDGGNTRTGSGPRP